MESSITDFDAVVEAWRAAVPFEDPHPEFIRGWLRAASLEDVTAIIARLANMHRRNWLDADRPEDHAGRFVSSHVRRLREQRQAQQVQPLSGEPAAYVPVPEQSERWRESWTDSAQQ